MRHLSNLSKFRPTSQQLKVMGLIVTGVSYLLSTEMQKRETRELIDKALDERAGGGEPVYDISSLPRN